MGKTEECGVRNSSEDTLKPCPLLACLYHAPACSLHKVDLGSLAFDEGGKEKGRKSDSW
jgi:hypothetical protein